jgi:tungstate transport system substrate-binding protein
MSGLVGPGLKVAVLGFWLLALVGGCSRQHAARSRPTVRLKLATTTSTQDSGLLDVILPAFEQSSGLRVDVIAVGTGKALALGENGDVDAVLVHAPEAEEAFVRAGFGVNRREVMANDFVILGPPEDPAGVREARDIASAFVAIARAEAPFVSRGDESGTHQKEKQLWREANLQPQGAWYVETGQGMGPTLTMADEKRAYVLADRGTYLAFKSKVDLVILYQGAPSLANPYHVIAVNPARHPYVHYQEAMTLIDWLVSPEAQGLIAGFRQEGEVLFHPLAVPGAEPRGGAGR